MRASRLIWLGIVLLFGAAAGGSWLATRRVDTTLSFVLRDSVSGGWVYDATVTAGDKVIRSFFQSDHAPVARTFTGLQPGATELSVRAPGYHPVVIPVTLTRGANRLPEPIDLVGREIPDLTEIIVAIEQRGEEFTAEIRPVNSAGKAVLSHPVLDLWIAAMVSVQMDGGGPARSPVRGGGSRGPVTFAGRVQWRWDAAPETLFRYSVSIPGPTAAPARFYVVDTITLVPRQAVGPGLTDEIAQLWQRSTPVAFMAALQTDERFRVFVNTLWNVRFD